MEILLNELSLDGTLNDVDEFFPLLARMIEIQDLVFKLSIPVLIHNELYDTRVTKEFNLHDILLQKEYRIRADIQRYKPLLSQGPFWNDDQRHMDSDVYLCQHTDKKHGYSLAEACERDKLVISFKNQNFTDATIEVYKNGELIEIVSIDNKIDLLKLLYENGQIDDTNYCNYFFKGTKLSFEYFEEKYGFKNKETTEIKSFISTFERFIEMEWGQILQDTGLNYKKYTPSSANNWFRDSQYGNHDIYKFRASQKYRCFGYRRGDIFYVLRLETDHKQSDNG